MLILPIVRDLLPLEILKVSIKKVESDHSQLTIRHKDTISTGNRRYNDLPDSSAKYLRSGLALQRFSVQAGLRKDRHEG